MQSYIFFLYYVNYIVEQLANYYIPVLCLFVFFWVLAYFIIF